MSFFKKISSLFLESESNEEVILALDIGSGSTKALIFQIKKTNEDDKLKSIILGVGRAEIKTTGFQEGAQIKIINSCLEAVKEAENMAGFKAEQMVLGMAGPFIKCCSNSISFLREMPHKAIDLPEVKNIVQKAQRKVFEEIRKGEAKESGTSEIETKLIDGRVIDIKIDGYRVVDPIGFQGKELTLNILNTYSSLKCLKFLQQIKKNLGIKALSVADYPQAVFLATNKNIFKSTSLAEISSILIDVGAKTTEVSLAHNGFIEGPKVISLGGDSFTKKIKDKLRLTEKEAEELKVKYSQGQLSNPIKRKIIEIIKPDLEIWRQGIETILLNSFSHLENLPSLVLFAGGSCVLPLVKKSIEDENWQKKFNFLSEIQTRFIQSNEIEAVDDRLSQLNSPGYIFPLSLANFGLLLTKKKTDINLILKKIIHLMQT